MNTNTTFNPAEKGEVLSLDDLMTDFVPATEDIIPTEEETQDTEIKEEEAVKETAPKEEKQEEVKQPESKLKEIVRKNIESGKWFGIDGFEEMEVDEDVFEQIIDAQTEQAKTEATENTVKVDNLSPMMVKALEIDKNGGNVSQVFETYKNIYENPQNPIANLDLDNPAHQEQLLRFFHKSKGLEDFEVNSIIQGHKQNMTLDKASTKAKTEIDTVFDNYLQKQVEDTENQKLHKAEALKAYEKNLSEEAKKYELNETYRKKIVAILAKPDEKGVYKQDAIYDEWRRDPAKALKLAMFMDNEEEYVKTRAGKVLTNEKEKIFLTIKSADKGKGSGMATDYNSSKEKKEDISLETL